MKTFKGFLQEALMESTKKADGEREYNKVHKFWTSKAQGGSHREDGFLHKSKGHTVLYHHLSDRGDTGIVGKHPDGYSNVSMDEPRANGESRHDVIEKQISHFSPDTKKVIHSVVQKHIHGEGAGADAAYHEKRNVD